jgi:hypothetical protein
LNGIAVKPPNSLNNLKKDKKNIFRTVVPMLRILLTDIALRGVFNFFDAKTIFGHFGPEVYDEQGFPSHLDSFVRVIFCLWITEWLCESPGKAKHYGCGIITRKPLRTARDTLLLAKASAGGCKEYPTYR